MQISPISSSLLCAVVLSGWNKGLRSQCEAVIFVLWETPLNSSEYHYKPLRQSFKGCGGRLMLEIATHTRTQTGPDCRPFCRGIVGKLPVWPATASTVCPFSQWRCLLESHNHPVSSLKVETLLFVLSVLWHLVYSWANSRCAINTHWIQLQHELTHLPPFGRVPHTPH